MSSPIEPINENVDHQQEDENPIAGAGEEEDTGAQIAPIVQLQEVAVTTGEENEDCILELKAKLYRFDKEGNQWKERGVGTVKLLKHKETGKVRLVMRQNKTLKIIANHLVLPTMTTQEHAGNEKSCVWHAADFADGELKDETFAIRFPSVENCKDFREKIEEIAESQGKKDTEEDSSAADLIEKLSVENKDSEQKHEDEKESTPAKEKENDADAEAAAKKE